MARQLRPIIEEHADATETGATISAPVVDAVAASGLFRLQLPAELGGMEADVDTIVDVFEELSYADGSTGWVVAINAFTAACAAYVTEPFARPVAAATAVAGVFAPLGVAEEQTDAAGTVTGYQISGRFGFGSGSNHAQFMGGAALITRGGTIAGIDDDGALPVLGFILPIDRIVLRGNWDVMGLKGTGSYDFEIPDQFVEVGATWKLFAPGVRTSCFGGPNYGLGTIVLGTISTAAWSIGVAERALHEIRSIAMSGRTRLGAEPLAHQSTFQRQLGFHCTAVESVRVLCKHSYNAAIKGSARGADPVEFTELMRTTRAVGNYVTQVCKETVTWAWEQSGSVGIRNPSVLQRCFRDIYVGCGHVVFDDRNYLELAKSQLGLEVSLP